MARLPALVDALAAVDGRERGVLDHMAREIREAGLIQTTKRGRGSAEMSSLDAAHLLLGVYGSNGRGTAAEAASIFGSLQVLHLPNETSSPIETWPTEVWSAQCRRTLADAIAVIIDAGRNLAKTTSMAQGSLAVHGPFHPHDESSLELEDWPNGTSVLLRLHRPHIEAYLQFAWPGAESVDNHTITFIKEGAAFGGSDSIVAYETNVLVHTRLFQTMHRALFAEP